MKIVNGADRSRPGVFIVDYRDAAGKRHVPSFPTEEEAEAFVERELAHRETGGVNLNCTFEDFLPTCLTLWRDVLELEEGTIENYLQICEGHIFPFFGTTRMRDVTLDNILEFKAHLKTQVTRGGKYKTPLKRGTVLLRGTITKIVGTLSGLFTLAIYKKIRPDNPAARNGRLANKQMQEQDRIQPIAVGKALTKPERDRLLLAARLVVNLTYYVWFCLLAGTGVRPGEARALRWKHIDLDGSQDLHDGVPMLSVLQSFKRKDRLGCTKNKKSRLVEIDPALCALLQAYYDLRQPQPGDFVFSEEASSNTALTGEKLRKPWPTLLALAGITRWVPIYCLRHTYASILIWAGVPTSFVCAQLGHVNTATTEKYYKHWIRSKSNGVLAKLDLARTLVVPPVARPRKGGGDSHGTPRNVNGCP